MKTSQDPRHLKRRQLVKSLFAQSFTDQKSGNIDIKRIIKSLDKIDKVISDSAPAWPIEKINKIDLAILRVSIHELMNEKTPPKVVIDEAVELAKEYGSESSPGFVNGVLGSVFIYLKKDLL
jgi:transcription antitermination factor NusB